MTKTLSQSAIALAILFATASGFLVIPATAALGVEALKGTQGTGIELASVQEEVSALRAEIARITEQVNRKHESSEHPLSWYCRTLSETVRSSGVVPGPCLSVK